MLLFMLCGMLVMFYGDELALIDQLVLCECQCDHFGFIEGGVLHDLVCMLMFWSDGLNAGFSTVDEVVLWLLISVEYVTINVEVQLVDLCSSLSLYCVLLALRCDSVALWWGSYVEHFVGDEHCFVYVCEVGGEWKFVVLNLGGELRCLVLGEQGCIVLLMGFDREGEMVDGELVLVVG